MHFNPQSVLDQRGYLVIATFDEYKPGDVIRNVDWSLDRTISDVRDIPVVVLTKTDRSDFIEQHRLLGLGPWFDSRRIPNYYRVMAE